MKKSSKKIIKVLMIAIVKFVLAVAAIGLLFGMAMVAWAWAVKLAPIAIGIMFVGLLIRLAYKWSLDDEPVTQTQTK